MEKYVVATEVNSVGAPINVIFPYNEAFLLRHLNIDDKSKRFSWRGSVTPGLFGKERFSAASSRSITITEGATDALSVYEILGFPAVSVRSSSSAKADVQADFDYVNSFEKIYLCFDNDVPGHEATQVIASMFPFNKVYFVRLDRFKDANEYLGEAPEEFKKLWWNSKRWTPDNIISTYSEIDALLEEETADAYATYPFARLQEMTYGIRPGEVVLFKALEGVGKTEVLRAIEYHILKTTDLNMGVIHLEESKKRLLKGLVGYELDMPVHLPDCTLDRKQIKETFRAITGRDERFNIFKHYGTDDPDQMLGSIRFMVSVLGCKVVTLDHITMLVSGNRGDDERRVLDYLSTCLGMLTEELGFTLIMISHVNDEGLTRGSRNISKIAHLVVSLDRDLTSEDEVKKNTTHLVIHKNRFAGLTGHAGSLYFDRATFKLSDIDATPLPF
jgi:twinkle protein